MNILQGDMRWIHQLFNALTTSSRLGCIFLCFVGLWFRSVSRQKLIPSYRFATLLECLLFPNALMHKKPTSRSKAQDSEPALFDNESSSRRVSSHDNIEGESSTDKIVNKSRRSNVYLDWQLDRLQKEYFKTLTVVEDPITYLDSDSEVEISSNELKSFARKNLSFSTSPSRKRANPQDNNLRPPTIQLDTNKSPSSKSPLEENCDAFESPKYEVWLSPPKLNSFKEPECIESNDVKDAYNLKSVAEHNRIKSYLKRIEEENLATLSAKAIPISMSMEKKSLQQETDIETSSNEVENISPANFDKFDDIVDEEELVFTPINIDWNGYSVDTETKREIPLASRFNNEPKRRKKVEIRAGKMDTEKATVEENRASPWHNIDTNTQTGYPSNDSFKHRSSSILSSKGTMRTPLVSRSTRSFVAEDSALSGSSRRTVNQSIRRGSIRRSRSRIGTVSSKKSSWRSFAESESQCTSFAVNANMKAALDLVAAICQHHLKVTVYKKRGGDKLRVESRYAGGHRFRVVLKFREHKDIPKITWVELRASKLDRDATAHYKMEEFFGLIVKQLEIDGRIANIDFPREELNR